MSADEYRNYLASTWWRLIRQRALERAGHRCEACGSARWIQVHHRTYERLGRERDSDLRVLCRLCHELVHDTQHQRGIALPHATDLVAATATEHPTDDEFVSVADALSTVVRQLIVRSDTALRDG